jgi:hypothetical protein
MKTFLFGAAVAALCVSGLMAAPAAHAAVYISQLEYKDGANGTFDYGQVKIEELAGGDDVKLTITLNPVNVPGGLIVDTGGHSAFAFSLLDSPNSTATILSPVPGPYSVDPTIADSFDKKATPAPFHDASFGYFLDAIDSSTTGGNGTPPPLVIDIHNASGITFAGVGTAAHPVTTNADDVVTGFGVGNRFQSNPDGYWFALDIYDPAATGDSKTFLVAAKDAVLQPGVPEPATWGLMIVGFGGVGAVLRRRRAAVALA